MCGDSVTTVSLLKERHHTVVFKIIRECTSCAHHCSGGMVISFKEALLVLTCRESSLHRESLQKEFVKVVKLQAEIQAHVHRPLETVQSE